MRKLTSAAVALIVAACTGRQPATPTCDRGCLIGIADKYLAAIAAHDPKKAPLSDEIVFVENIKRTKPGEGIWAAAAAHIFKITGGEIDGVEALGIFVPFGSPTGWE